MEVLVAKTRGYPAIPGFLFPQYVAPLPVLSLYADDTMIKPTSDAATLAGFNTYAYFEGTGFKIIMDKCEGLWLRSWHNKSHKKNKNKWEFAVALPQSGSSSTVPDRIGI